MVKRRWGEAGRGQGTPSRERSPGPKQLHRCRRWGSQGSTEGAPWLLMGRGACPKWGQRQLLCPPPVGQLLGGRGRPIPATYHGMQTLGMCTLGYKPLSPDASKLLVASSAHSFPLWRRWAKNKTTSERFYLRCLPAAVPCCRTLRRHRNCDSSTRPLALREAAPHVSILDLVQGGWAPAYPTW